MAFSCLGRVASRLVQENALAISEDNPAPIRGGDRTNLVGHLDPFGRQLTELAAGHRHQRDLVFIQDGRKHIETYAAAIVSDLGDLCLATAERGHRRGAQDVDARDLSGGFQQVLGLG